MVPEIIPGEDIELEGIVRHVLSLFERVVNLAPYLPDDLLVFANSVRNPGHLADIIASTLNLKLPERQELLRLNDVGKRLRRLTELLNREIEILEIGSKIQEQVKSEMEKTQREYVLREQLKAIQRELGDMEGGLHPELQDLREKLQQRRVDRRGARGGAARDRPAGYHQPRLAGIYGVAHLRRMDPRSALDEILGGSAGYPRSESRSSTKTITTWKR